jgi:prepilin-type N-terminal cleavage/methylation domain-containing protein
MNRRRGFTVVEMLVVIGILVVVSLGVATIFQSIGETVSRGRKLSELNQFAARLERVMPDDFEQMTRDGFLVIINKNAGAGRDVQLYRGETTDRDGNGIEGSPRRSDEIMFFARGNFVSQRRAIAPNMIATSNEAAIYYGHGQKRRPQISVSDPAFDEPRNLFFNPQPWDNNFDATLDTRVGYSTPGFVNPNEFARDWSLLRVVTLLTNPQGPGQQVPAELYGLSSDDFGDRPRLTDSPRQIMLQPAARSIFKSLNGSARIDPSVGGMINRSLYDLTYQGQPSSPAQYPLYLPTSGMVDIVSQDLASIRAEIQALAVSQFPSAYMNYNAAYANLPTPSPPGGIGTRDLFEYQFYELSSPPNPSDARSIQMGRYNSDGVWDTVTRFEISHVQRIRSWMIDALPSAWSTGSNTGLINSSNFFAGVRYEDIPTRLLFNEDDFASTDRGSLERAYAEANQEMLGSSIFVPRCTEFIVEWSYGFVDNSLASTALGFKQLEWYGLNRFVDSNNNGMLDAGDARAAERYIPRFPSEAGMDPAAGGASRPLGMSASVVMGRTTVSAANDVEAACFGFVTDPSAVDDPATPTEDEGTGTYWPWPKLIRITMTLGDPTDRDVEETYQIIFEVPEPE